MRQCAWHEALLAIEKGNVVLLLMADHPTSRLLEQRMKSMTRVYSERGYVSLSVKVDEDCAPHPELAAVRLPQIRVFTDGEETNRLLGTQDEDVLVDLV